jgi:molecular chaperone GrpE
MTDTKPNASGEFREQMPAPSAGEMASENECSESGQSKTARLRDLELERDTLLDRLARAQAEFENSRRRLEREQREYRDLALAEAVRSLLPSVDSLDWALQSPVESVEDFRSGIKLVRQQLQSALEQLGVSQINSKGELFDPRFHEAIDLVEVPGSVPNTVVEELRPGYKLGNRLLRPATVLVASNIDSKTGS